MDESVKSPAASGLDLRKCPRCGTPLTGPDGLCGVCMLDSGLEGEESPEQVASSFTAARQFDNYELIEEIARGGMGVVFKARQLNLNRIVALKMMLGGQLASEPERARFRAEAETAARLRHPNIVAIHEVGENEGQPFFSMDFIEGQNLSQVVGITPLPARQAAKVLKSITDAVHYAHQEGVLHRDLKPSNVLVDGNGVPHVTDFGLAKKLDGDASLTLTGQVVGSPSFIPPEQAESGRGKPTAGSDVYSLGAMLYFLLTARPPFVAETIPAILRMVAESEPVSPRLLNASVPQDLETICLKCLEKSAARRYATAGELAEELGRFLRDEPIHARPASRMEKSWRWCRRHRALATLASALVITVVIGSTGLVLAFGRSRKSEKQAISSLRDALLGEARSQRLGGRLGQRFETIETLRRAAKIRVDSQLRDELAAALATFDLRLQRKWPIRNRTTLDRVYLSPDLEWYAEDKTGGGFNLRSSHDRSIVRTFTRASDVNLVAAIFSPDSQWLAALFRDGAVEIWNINGKEPAMQFAGGSKMPTMASFRYYAAADFSPRGDSLAIAPPEEGLWLESLTGKGRRVIDAAGGGALFLRFDPSGGRLAVQRLQELEIWDVERGVRLWRQELEFAQPGIAWSPDGQLIAVVSSRTAELMLHDAASGKLVQRLGGHQRTPWIWEFHPNGQWLASVSQDQTLRVWDVRSGEQLLQVESAATALQFSRDGRYLIAAVDPGEVGIYEIAPGSVFREWQSVRQGLDFPGEMAASADDRFLVSAAVNNLYVWDERARGQISSVSLPFGGIYSLLFGPDDHEIIYSRGVNIYRRSFTVDEKSTLATVALGAEELVAEGSIVSLGPDKNSWLVRRSNIVELWPEGREKDGRVVAKENWHPNGVAMSPDGKWIVPVDYPGRALRLWNSAGGEKPHTLEGHFGAAWFSPDGKWLVGCDGAGYQFWEVESWKPGPKFPAKLVGGARGLVSFGRGGRQVALRIKHDTFQIVRLPDGAELMRLESPFPLDARRMIMSEDGSRLRILGTGHRLFEWDLARLSADLVALVNLPVNLTDVVAPRDEPIANPSALPAIPPPANTPSDPLGIRATLANADPVTAIRRFDKVAKSLMDVKNHRDVERLFSEVMNTGAANDVQTAALLWRRADFLCRLDRWQEAIADVRKIIELQPANDTNVFTLALLLAVSGDATGYQHQRREILARFGSTTDTFVARRVGKVCLILPAEGEELATAVRLTEQEMSKESGWYQLGRGLAEYRAGRFAEALDWTTKASAAGKPSPLLAQCRFVEAMAQHRLGQTEKARMALVNGTQIMQANAQWQRNIRLGIEWGWAGDWGDWMLAKALMKEASSFIEKE